jgi:periplasmic divalent cation tolerance protein
LTSSVGRARDGRIEAPRLRLRWTDVFHDEDFFSRFDQPELAPGDFFNGPGIVAKAPRLVGQPRILGALARDCRRQFVVLASCAQRGEQAAIADQRVKHDDADDKHQQNAADSSGWRIVRPLGGLFLVARSECWLRHVRPERYTNFTQSTTAMTDVVLVLSTVPDDESAERLARTLVDEKLAACVSLHPPMVSIYRWKGRVESSAERQLVIKTTRERLPTLEARIKALHSYELPEFIVVAVEGGSKEYLSWVRQQ